MEQNSVYILWILHDTISQGRGTCHTINTEQNRLEWNRIEQNRIEQNGTEQCLHSVDPT